MELDKEITAVAALLTIHEDRLPAEWVQQPVHYLHAVRLSARCHADVSAAELELRIFEADRDLTLRAEGLPDGIKQTEAAIQHAIRLDPRYRELQEQRTAAQHRAALMFGIVKAFEQRYGSLKALTQIFGPQQSNYGAIDPDVAVAAAAALRAR